MWDSFLIYLFLIVTWTLIILFLINDCRNTHTRRTNLFCMYLSFIVSHVDMQLEIYRCINSVGKSTVVVNLLTTSIECRDISIFTSTLKYSVICLDFVSFRSTSIAIRGLCSTNNGSCNKMKANYKNYFHTVYEYNYVNSFKSMVKILRTTLYLY